MKYEYLKGSEKDFEGAPEGCTKVLVCFGETHYVIGDKTSEGLTVESSDEDNYLIAERRPITEPVWDGEGLPPVGGECEVLFTSEGSVFERARILHVGDDGIVGRWLAGDSAGGLFDYMYIPHDYRPIRSPEDVARDEFGAAVAGYLDVRPNGVRMSELYDAIAAGKIKGVVMESKVADLKINITTDEMWREFEKKSDMEDVYKLVKERAYRRGSF